MMGINKYTTGIFHVVATNDNYNYQGMDDSCIEVLIRGHFENNGLVWVSLNEQFTEDNCWPLGPYDVMGFPLNDLNELHIFIEKEEDRAIVLYTNQEGGGI